MTPKQNAFASAAEGIIRNLEKRGMEGYFYENSTACAAAIKEMLPENCTVSWGGSESLKESGIMDMLNAGNYRRIDRLTAKNPEQARELFAQTVMADYYFMGTNAITLDGELVNIDGNGNRVACLIHGPANVIVIAGMNKVVPTADMAVSRIRNFAAPPNAKRLNRQTPCLTSGRCGDCFAPECMCSQIVFTRRSSAKGRIKVFLVAETLGY